MMLYRGGESVALGWGILVGEYAMVEESSRGDTGVGEDAALFTTVPHLVLVWGRALHRGWRGRRALRHG